MRKFLLIASLFLASSANAYVQLTGGWAGNGEIKLAQQDQYPFGGYSTWTYTRNWDGTNIKVFGLKNESIGWALYLFNNSSTAATSVKVTMTPLVGTLGYVISSTAALCAQTTSYINRPYSISYSTYVPILGMTSGAWAAPPYEERDLTTNFRNACTVNANNDCIANTASWATRYDANKYMPTGLIPSECLSSGVIVSTGTSQMIWTDLYIDKTVPSDVYNGTVKVYEGVILSTSIPIQLIVYNGTLPDKPALTVLADVSQGDINFRHNGTAHGSTCSTTACINTRNHYYQTLHHEGITPIGDVPDVNTNDYPSVEYQNQLNGTLYSTSNGYYGRGMTTGSPYYSVGTYASINNNPSFSGTNIGPFCTVISSWSAYFANNFPSVKAFNYWADEPTDYTLTNKYSTWATTVTACTANGVLNGWVTGKWPSVSAGAPKINSPASTNWTLTGTSSNTWAAETVQYTTAPATAFGYNGHPSWSGTMYAIDDDGLSPMQPIVAAKKLGLSGWFLWQTTNWYNPGNQSPSENCLWKDACSNPAKTFGFDSFPSTDNVKGRYGFNYGNGDGVLLYPGTDTAYPNASLGIDGPIEDIRLKYIRNGINYADYAALASAINPSSTTAILQNVVGASLYEVGCFTNADCTYAYGGRRWSQDPNVWENQREALAIIIANGTPPPTTIPRNIGLTGAMKMRGGVLLR